ncbi:MAG: DUF460 domain-containing protein [Candidatus Micrarchaeia archaeon]
MIVGVDGGKTAAIACLGLDGKPLRLFTGRFVGLEWFVSNIKSTGEPLIIASDKKRPDYIARKLAAVFGAKLFAPSTDISVDRKKELAGKTENLHERDALAAARVAYNAYANKLNQIEKMAKNKSKNSDLMKALVIGRRYSMHEAALGSKSGRASGKL